MKKVGTWLLNNLKWIFALVVVAVTAIVVANTMLGSYNDYKAYESTYYENDLEVRSNAPANPLSIEIDDDFASYDANLNVTSTKSRYANKQTVSVEDLKVTTTQAEYIVEDYIDLTEKGGTIALAMTLEEKSFVDIDFVISSVRETKVDDEVTYGVKDLLANVDFIVNGETMEETVDLENSSSDPEWHHLVMSGFALPAGDVTVTIKSKSSKAAMMPQLRNISLFSSKVLSLAE